MSKQDIAIEYYNCQLDPIYAIEKFFHTIDLTKGKRVPFLLFEQQKEMVMALEKTRHNIVTKPRQAGVSMVMAAYTAVKMAFATSDRPENVVVIANKAKQAELFLKHVKMFLTQIPAWVWGETYDYSKQRDGHVIGQGAVRHLKLVNGGEIQAFATSPDAIRGMTPTRIIVDEAAFIENGAELYSASMAALITGGSMYLLSTPRGHDELYYKAYTEALNNVNGFNIVELRWWRDDRYNSDLEWIYKDEDGVRQVEPEVSFTKSSMYAKYKMGWKPTSTWYREFCGTLNNDDKAISQELDNSFIGSGGNVIHFSHIERQKSKYLLDPIYRGGPDNNMWVWKWPEVGRQYCLFADVSRGDGSDYSAFQIIDVEEGEQVAEYKGKLKSNYFADLIFEYGNMYNAITNIDVTGGYGENLMNDLKQLNYKLMITDDNGEPKGLQISGANRPKIFGKFVQYIEQDAYKIHSLRLFTELETFVWVNGRPDHIRGFNDDAISSYAGNIWTIETKFRQLKETETIQKKVLNSWSTGFTSPNNAKPNKRIYQGGVDVTKSAWIFAR